VTLPLDKETLAAAYDYLRTTPPFSRWNLPDSEEIIFSVSKTSRDFGWYRFDGKRHCINASTGKIGQTNTLMEFMAHEMVHLHLEQTGVESRRGTPYTHNAAFKRFAAQACKAHGFDPKAFF